MRSLLPIRHSTHCCCPTCIAEFAAYWEEMRAQEDREHYRAMEPPDTETCTAREWLEYLDLVAPLAVPTMSVSELAQIHSQGS